MYYVIRDNAQRPATFHNLLHELIWKLPLNMNIATFRRDNNTLFQLIRDLIAGNNVVTSWFKSDKSVPTEDGRQGFESITKLCLGTDAMESKRTFWEGKLNKAQWTGYGVGKASETLIADLFNYYSQLSLLGEEYTELKKIRNFNDRINEQQDLIASTCVKSVRDKALEYIRLLKLHRTVDQDGRALTFAEFTAFVIDEERQWVKSMKKRRSISQVTTSNSTEESESSDSEADSNDPCSDGDPCGDDDSSVHSVG